jgi:hypothetical protein
MGRRADELGQVLMDLLREAGFDVHEWDPVTAAGGRVVRFISVKWPHEAPTLAWLAPVDEGKIVIDWKGPGKRGQEVIDAIERAGWGDRLVSSFQVLDEPSVEVMTRVVRDTYPSESFEFTEFKDGTVRVGPMSPSMGQRIEKRLRELGVLERKGIYFAFESVGRFVQPNVGYLFWGDPGWIQR